MPEADRETAQDATEGYGSALEHCQMLPTWGHQSLSSVQVPRYLTAPLANAWLFYCLEYDNL